jgi:hypothetical protein
MLDGLLAGEDIDRMPPAHRQRFAQAPRRAVDMLERPHAKPRQEAQDGPTLAECEIGRYGPRAGTAGTRRALGAGEHGRAPGRLPALAHLAPGAALTGTTNPTLKHLSATSSAALSCQRWSGRLQV